MDVVADVLNKIKEMPGITLGAIGGLLSAVGIKAILVIARKVLPGLLGKLIRKLVLKGMDAKKPHVKNLVRAAICYLEAEIPDRGQGQDKYARLIAMLGVKSHEKEMLQLIEDIVGNVDEELKKVSGAEGS